MKNVAQLIEHTEPAVERKAELLGLMDHIEMPGAVPQEHLKKHLGKADVFVLPCVEAAGGDMDGIPVALMEAMAMELATVSTPISCRRPATQSQMPSMFGVSTRFEP